MQATMLTEPGGDDEVHAVREAPQESATRLAVDGRVSFWHAGDLGESDVDGAQELTTESGRALLVPQCGVQYVCLGGRADDEAHGSAGLVEPLLDAAAHDLPGFA